MRLTGSAALAFTAVALTGCTNGLERRLEANERRVEQLEEELTQARRTLAHQGTRVGELETDVAGLDSSREGNAQKLDKLDGRVSGLETAVRTRRNEVSRLGRDMRDLSRQLGEHKDEVLFVWDAADRFLGQVVEHGEEGVLFVMPDIAVPIFTELVATNEVALYFTGPGCTGKPVAIVEATGGLLGFLRQSTAEVFVPTGRYARERVQSASYLVPEGGCVAVEGVFEVEELAIERRVDPFTPEVRLHSME